MKKIEKFRNYIAESGCKLTIEETKQIYKQLQKFERKIKNLSQFDILNIKNMDGLDENCKESAIRLFTFMKDI